MNQLNLLQEKLQSNVISYEEQKALKGKRGRVFRGKFSFQGDTNDTTSSSHYDTSKTSSGSGTISNTSSPTIGSSSSSGTESFTKFGKNRIV